MFLINQILDFLFPPACPICKSGVLEPGTMCGKCWANFNWIGNPKCYICGYPFPANLDLGDAPMCPVCASGKNELDYIRSACVYDTASKNIMLPFKHGGALRFGTLMSRAMIRACADIPNDFDLIMPVPLSGRRMWKRGYNQATLIARPISKHFGIKMDLDTVRRHHRPDMGHKNAAARAENIRGVFYIKNPDNIKGKTILLIDDVMTTGATFSEMRRVLMRAGATAVYGVCFCRVVRAI